MGSRMRGQFRIGCKGNNIVRKLIFMAQAVSCLLNSGKIPENAKLGTMEGYSSRGAVDEVVKTEAEETKRGRDPRLKTYNHILDITVSNGRSELGRWRNRGTGSWSHHEWRLEVKRRNSSLKGTEDGIRDRKCGCALMQCHNDSLNDKNS